MAKRKKIGKSLSTQDWMQYRPYKEFTSYDGYYLKLAKMAFEYLNDPGHGFRHIFEREDLREMAVVLTSFYEDFISEIGLWQALIRKHQELYGQFLPFYDMREYDPDYLNPQDFAYLLWHQLGSLGGKILSPYGKPVLDAADHFYRFFEERIDESPVTDFYDKWLDLTIETNYFVVKKRRIWMATQNYLLGPELNNKMKERVTELYEEKAELMERMDPTRMLYGIQEDILMKQKTSWCAFSAAEWLAEVGEYSDVLRGNIRQLIERVEGIFLYEGSDEKYYHFKFVPSNRLFAIHRESVNINVSSMKPGKDLAYFGIVKWNDDWWISGVFMGLGPADKYLDELRMDNKYGNFYGWTKVEQEKMLASTKEMEEAFIQYFGQRLAFFPDDQSLAKALADHNDWWNEHRTSGPFSLSESNSRLAKKFKERPSNFDEMDLGDGAVAAFFTPNEGVMMSGVIPDIVALLQKDSLTEEEADELFYTFFYEIEPPLANYIMEHYPMDNLRFPMVPTSDFTIKNFDLLLRYFNPNGFKQKLPNMTLLT